MRDLMEELSMGRKLLRGSYTQYTPTGKSLFVKAGKWSTTPHLGDIVYFYTPSLGRVSHVGIVVYVAVSKNTFSIQTVEGNTSSAEYDRNGGCVALKTYRNIPFTSVGGTNRINGFGTPAFGDDTCSAEELIATAMAEVGYLEKASNKNLDSKTANAGDKNFTKYGAWYGNNGVYWCQQFVSWCAYAACKRHAEMATGWERAGDKWKYRYRGEYVKNQWMQIGGRWYVFDGSGTMVTGWFKQNGSDYYYMNPSDGAMLSGQWIEYDDGWYYLTASGIMAESAYIKDDKGRGYCWVNEYGVWDGSYMKNPDLKKNELAE